MRWSLAFVTSALAAESTVEKRLLPLHSLVDGLLDDSYWTCSGGCRWGDYGLSLSDVDKASRGGSLTSKLPLLTDNFEAVVELARTTKPESVSHGAAIFLTPWTEPPLTPGRVFGTDGKFDGLGFFVANLDRNNKRNPSLSGVVQSDGRRLDGRAKIPSEKGIYWTPLEGQYRLLLSVIPGQVSGKVYHPDKAVYADVFTLPLPTYPSGGYRLSIFAGADDMGEIDEIAVKSVTVNNLNLSMPGESVDSPSYVSGGDLSGNSGDIAKVVAQHVLLSNKARHDELIANVRQANQRLEAMEHKLNSLESVVLGQTPVQLDNVKGEIESVRRILDSTHRQFSGINHSMNSVQEKLALANKSKNEGVIQALTDHVEKVQTSITSGSKTTFYMTLFVLAVVTTGILLLWRRLTKMEKQHYF